MKKYILILFFVFGTTVLYAQKDIYREMNGVKFYTFSTSTIPDSLEICYGEGIESTPANSMVEISPVVLKVIAQKVLAFKCAYVFMDLNKFYHKKVGEVYWLGLSPKVK